MKKINSINCRAFTLVELLAVIVILGIILGITIPSAVNLINSQSQRKYAYHENIVKEAVDTYIDQYGDSFQEGNEGCRCYQISYSSLIEENLLKEDDIECNASSNDVILAYPIDDSRNNFRYEYYLNCKDKANDELVHEGGTPPSDCCGVSGIFMVTEVILKYNDENGDIYPQNDNNWTNQNVYQKFEANDPYMSGIKGYEYSTDGGRTWISVNTDHITLSGDINNVVQVRAVDNDGHKSSVKTYTVRIDKTKPNADFAISGTKGDGGWYSSDVSIGVANQSDGSGSGIKEATVDIPRLTNETSGQVVTLTVTDNVGNVQTKTTTIRIDKTKPIIQARAAQVETNTVISSGATSNRDLIVTPVSVNNPISGTTLKYCLGANCNPNTSYVEGIKLTSSNTVCFQSKSGSGLSSDKVCYDAVIRKQETISLHIESSSSAYSNIEGFWNWGWGNERFSYNYSNSCVDLTDVQKIAVTLSAEGNSWTNHGNSEVRFLGSAGVRLSNSTSNYLIGSFTLFFQRGSYGYRSNSYLLEKDVSSLVGTYCFYVSTTSAATNDHYNGGTYSGGTATITSATLYY